MEDREVLATVALSLVPGVGSQRLRTLIATFGSAEATLAAPESKLAATLGIGSATARAIKETSIADGARACTQVAQMGARVLLAGDPEFPDQLAEIPEPPVVLYFWGDMALLRRPIVAMVGSRDHTEYGGEAARVLASAVATRAVVVSGMARGIDAIVHTAALDAGGGSIGVLGNGFGVVYPQANRALYDLVLVPQAFGQVFAWHSVDREVHDRRRALPGTRRLNTHVWQLGQTHLEPIGHVTLVLARAR